MKKMTALLLVLVSITVSAQKKSLDLTEVITATEIEAHLSFLAADEMQGRNAGSRELDIAANYIRTQFKIHGLKTVPGAEQYFQSVQQVKNQPFKRAQAMIGDQRFTFKESLLLFDGDSLQWDGDLVYVGYGSPDDLKKHDVRGKMVLALTGSRDADSFREVLSVSTDKAKYMKLSGAIGLVEILVFPQTPWAGLVGAYTQTTWGIQKEGGSIPHLWLKPQDVKSLQFQEGQIVKGSLSLGSRKHYNVPGKNVIGLIEGTDPKLKDEYIILTAHYDHIGVQRSINGQDSIFNGARDNAIGTVALVQTAKYLSANPPKHSVLIIALTSEEKGLLGSQWYTEHPLVPLNKTILSINCDGVGYNDKSILTSISWGRTSTDELVARAANVYGLNVGGDPDPNEGFFERSDQVSFARKGIVAIKLQPGLAQMDDDIRKYYHRQADEVSSLDFGYLTKFYKSFVHAVALLANETKRPSWNKGDKYYPVSKQLYGD